MSSPALHPDERAVYERQLLSRAQQLVRLLNNGVRSGPLLALFVGQLLRAAIPLCGESLAAELFEWLARQYRQYLGRCPLCGAEKATGTLMCSRCDKDMEAIDRDLLLHSAGGSKQ
jgi:hypothetical protein